MINLNIDNLINRLDKLDITNITDYLNKLDITNQSHDFMLKSLSKSNLTQMLKKFKIYNITSTKTVRFVDIPNELPLITANIRRPDIILKTDDLEEYHIIEFMSSTPPGYLINFLEYVVRLIIFIYKKTNIEPTVYLTVVYTNNIKSARRILDSGSNKLTINQIFYSDIDGDAIYNKAKEQLDLTSNLDEETLLDLLQAPFCTTKIDLQQFIFNCLTLAEQYTDLTNDTFLLLRMFVIVYKIYNNTEHKNKIVRRLKMSNFITDFSNSLADDCLNTIKEYIIETVNKANEQLKERDKQLKEREKRVEEIKKQSEERVKQLEERVKQLEEKEKQFKEERL
jgi:hypothetical protein